MTVRDSSRAYIRTEVRVLKTSKLLALLVEEKFQLEYLKQLSADRELFGVATNEQVVEIMSVALEEAAAEIDRRVPIPPTEH